MSAIAVATLTPRGGAPVGRPLCILCGEVGGVDILLNLLLFVPLGVGLALAGIRKRNAFLAMGAGSLAIELLQFFEIPGRDATVRDVLMNSVGGALGYMACARFDVLLLPRPSAARRLVLAWTVGWIVLQSVSAYAFVPALPTSQYYGQIARRLGKNLAAFPGKVLRATVDGNVIPNWELPDDRIRTLLLRPEGALVRVSVVPRGCASRLSGIVRIADARTREVLLLAQDRSDLVFGVRTGAHVLRLRPVRYRLRDAFSGGPGQCIERGDTINLQARYTSRAVLLSARRTEIIESSVAQGWRLFQPFQTFAGPGWAGSTITALWLVGLTVAAGYWLRFASRRQSIPSASVMAFLVLATVVIGLRWIPQLIDGPAASFGELLVAYAGVAAGASIAGMALKGRR
jgi:hypothetical protein